MTVLQYYTISWWLRIWIYLGSIYQRELQEYLSSLQYPLSPNFDDILEFFFVSGHQLIESVFSNAGAGGVQSGSRFLFQWVFVCLCTFLSSLSPWFFLIRLIIAWSKDWLNIADHLLFIIRKSNSLTSTSFHYRFCVFVKFWFFHKGCLAILFSPGWLIRDVV